jgi:hypothetical protein
MVIIVYASTNLSETGAELQGALNRGLFELHSVETVGQKATSFHPYLDYLLYDVTVQTFLVSEIHASNFET